MPNKIVSLGRQTFREIKNLLQMKQFGDKNRIKPDIGSFHQKPTKVDSSLQMKRFDRKIVCIEGPMFSTDGLYRSKSISGKHCFAFINYKHDTDMSSVSATLTYLELGSNASPEHKNLQNDKETPVNGITLKGHELRDCGLQMRFASQDELKEMKELINQGKVFLNVEDPSSCFKPLIKGKNKLIVRPKKYFEPFDLFQLISHNTVIQDFFSECEQGKYFQELSQLENVIKSAKPEDFQNSIWKNPNCAVMILFLLKQGKISFEEAVAANTYLTFIAELPESYRSKPEYQRSDRKDVERLVEGEELTEFGLRYAKCIVQSFKRKINVTIDQEKLEQYLLDLTPIEQYVTVSACKDYAMSSDSLENENRKTDSTKEDPRTVDRSLFSFLTNLPFVVGWKEEGIQCYCVPLSVQLINDFLEQISPEPVLLFPILGTANDSTLELLHNNRLHPWPYFLPEDYIATNIISKRKGLEIDGDCVDWWVALVHDLTHAAASNLLTREQRAFCLEELIPAMRMLVDNYPVLLKLCVKFCNAIVDFNLTGEGGFKLDGGDNLRRFMKSKVNIGYRKSLLENQKIGDTNNDLLYLMLCFSTLSTHHLEYKLAYQLILECCFDTDHRDPEVIRALQALASNHQDAQKGQLISKDNRLASCGINWESWQTLFNFILEKIEDEQEYNEFFWRAIEENEQLHRELLTLIQNGLILCPNPNLCEQFPFGLTKEKINKFQAFLKANALLIEQPSSPIKQYNGNEENKAQFFPMNNGQDVQINSDAPRLVSVR